MEGGGLSRHNLVKLKNIYDFMFPFYTKAIISPNVATLKYRDVFNYGNAL